LLIPELHPERSRTLEEPSARPAIRICHWKLLTPFNRLGNLDSFTDLLLTSATSRAATELAFWTWVFVCAGRKAFAPEGGLYSLRQARIRIALSSNERFMDSCLHSGFVVRQSLARLRVPSTEKKPYAPQFGSPTVRIALPAVSTNFVNLSKTGKFKANYDTQGDSSVARGVA
jgi:hypothetical protein